MNIKNKQNEIEIKLVQFLCMECLPTKECGGNRLTVILLKKRLKIFDKNSKNFKKSKALKNVTKKSNKKNS